MKDWYKVFKNKYYAVVPFVDSDESFWPVLKEDVQDGPSEASSVADGFKVIRKPHDGCAIPVVELTNGCYEDVMVYIKVRSAMLDKGIDTDALAAEYQEQDSEALSDVLAQYQSIFGGGENGEH